MKYKIKFLRDVKIVFCEEVELDYLGDFKNLPKKMQLKLVEKGEPTGFEQALLDTLKKTPKISIISIEEDK